jgi:hypothetical protein
MAESPILEQGKTLKFKLTHYRQQKHTHEAFIKWIVEEHLPLAIPIFKKHGVLGYSLVCDSLLVCDARFTILIPDISLLRQQPSMTH